MSESQSFRRLYGEKERDGEGWRDVSETPCSRCCNHDREGGGERERGGEEYSPVAERLHGHPRPAGPEWVLVAEVAPSLRDSTAVRTQVILMFTPIRGRGSEQVLYAAESLAGEGAIYCTGIGHGTAPPTGAGGGGGVVQHLAGDAPPVAQGAQ